MWSWWNRRSLRARMTIAATSVMALLIAGAASLLIWRVHDSLFGELDRTVLREANQTAAGAVAGGGGRPALPPGLSPSTAVQVVDGSGRVILSSTNLAGEARVFAFDPGGRGSLIRTVPATPLGDNDPYRVAAVSVRGPRGSTYLVYVGLPTAEISAAITELRAALTLGGPALVVVLASITWLLVGRSLRPVEVLRRQAASITATGLHQRVDVPPSSDELARLALTLNDLLARLESSVDQQRQFVADAAHELRSPIAAILSQLEVEDSYGGRAQDHAGAPVIGEVRRLSRLVDDLLALARLDTSPARSSVAVDLDEVVLAEVEALRHRTDLRVDARGITAARVQGDPGLIGRVVRNLLDNAERYARSRITVSLSRTDDAALLTIADDGPGIPVGDRERIFERFTRLEDGRSRDAGGVGLGLSIVRDVVTAHDGEVSVHDNLPGARFVIRLPTRS